MRSFVFNSGMLVGILLISCQPEASSAKHDAAATVSTQASPVQRQKSLDPISLPKPAPAKKSSIATEVEGHDMIQTIDGKDLPIVLKEDFTKSSQTLTIKIKNYNKPTITGQILTKVPGFDIRFNQIRTANGDFDGPFGLTLNYKTPDPGEIWLIVGRDLMATTTYTGKFEVKLK